MFNALDACEHLGIDPSTLGEYWVQCQNNDMMIKFGGGFYCGLVSVPERDPIYVFNGFFMNMRSKYVKPGASIHYFTVSFPATTLTWGRFRSDVVGATDPCDAVDSSLRGQILAEWQNLGLSVIPNRTDNGIHASASPFEGLVERVNWLNSSISNDHFGAQLLATGVEESTIDAWRLDPQIEEIGSVFDAFEDLDCTDALYKAVELSQIQQQPHFTGDENAAWETATDEHGNVYYYNSVTGESSWERPDVMGESLNVDAQSDENHNIEDEIVCDDAFEEKQYVGRESNNNDGTNEIQNIETDNDFVGGFEEKQYTVADLNNNDGNDDQNDEDGHATGFEEKQYSVTTLNNNNGNDDQNDEEGHATGFEEKQYTVAALNNNDGNDDPNDEDGHATGFEEKQYSVAALNNNDENDDQNDEEGHATGFEEKQYSVAALNNNDGNDDQKDEDDHATEFEEKKLTETESLTDVQQNLDRQCRHDEHNVHENTENLTSDDIQPSAELHSKNENVDIIFQDELEGVVNMDKTDRPEEVTPVDDGKDECHKTSIEKELIIEGTGENCDDNKVNDCILEERNEVKQRSNSSRAASGIEIKVCDKQNIGAHENIDSQATLRKQKRGKRQVRRGDWIKVVPSDVHTDPYWSNEVTGEIRPDLPEIKEIVDALYEDTVNDTGESSRRKQLIRALTGKFDNDLASSKNNLKNISTEKLENLDYKLEVQNSSIDLLSNVNDQSDATIGSTVACVEESDEKKKDKRDISMADNTSGATWLEVQDTDGEVYYYNQETDESAWSLPGNLRGHEKSGLSSRNSEISVSPVRIGDWVQIVGDESSGTYWTNEETGELRWDAPDGESIENDGIPAHRKELVQSIQSKADEDIVFFKLELLKKSVGELEHLNEITDTVDVLHLLKDDYCPPDEEEKLIDYESDVENEEDLQSSEQNDVSDEMGGDSKSVEMPFMEAQYEKQPANKVKEEEISTVEEKCSPVSDKKIHSPPPLITQDSFVAAQYAPHAMEEEKKEPPSKKETHTKKKYPPPPLITEDSFVAAQYEPHAEVKNLSPPMTEVISEIGVVECNTVKIDTLVGRLVDDDVVAYLDTTHYPVKRDGPNASDVEEQRFLKREMSCVTSLFEDCVDEVNVDEPQEELVFEIADRRRKLQIDLERSQREANERKERARLQKEELARKFAKERSIPLSQRAQTWCNDLHDIISKERRCDFSVSEEQDGIVVKFFLNNTSPRLTIEDITKYMTKLAISGYPQQQRLRICPNKWGQVFDDEPQSGKSSLTFLFFIPRIVLSKTKLPPSTNDSREGASFMSRTAPEILGGNGQSPSTEALGQSTLSSSRQGTRKKTVGKLKPVRGKKKSPVYVERVAPGFYHYGAKKY